MTPEDRMKVAIAIRHAVLTYRVAVDTDHEDDWDAANRAADDLGVTVRQYGYPLADFLAAGPSSEWEPLYRAEKARADAAEAKLAAVRALLEGENWQKAVCLGFYHYATGELRRALGPSTT